jgi:hypothetical protein
MIPQKRGTGRDSDDRLRSDCPGLVNAATQLISIYSPISRVFVRERVEATVYAHRHGLVDL